MPAVDASRIVEGLYQGSMPPVGLWVRQAGFDTLVLSAKEYQPSTSSFPGVCVVHVPLDDAKPSAAEKRSIELAGRLVASEVARGRRVLVTCAAGKNRSGIITAVAMRHLYPGATRTEIVDRIRARRRIGALSNPWFVASFRHGELGSVR